MFGEKLEGKDYKTSELLADIANSKDYGADRIKSALLDTISDILNRVDDDELAQRFSQDLHGALVGLANDVLIDAELDNEYGYGNTDADMGDTEEQMAGDDAVADSESAEDVKGMEAEDVRDKTEGEEIPEDEEGVEPTEPVEDEEESVVLDEEDEDKTDEASEEAPVDGGSEEYKNDDLPGDESEEEAPEETNDGEESDEGEEAKEEDESKEESEEETESKEDDESAEESGEDKDESEETDEDETEESDEEDKDKKEDKKPKSKDHFAMAESYMSNTKKGAYKHPKAMPTITESTVKVANKYL